MGLTLTVGPPSVAFEAGYADAVCEIFRERFGDAFSTAEGEELHSTDDMGWSWWGELIGLGQKTLGVTNVRHLGSIAAWCGVYVPVATEPFDVWPQVAPNDTAAEPDGFELGEFLTKLTGKKLGLRARFRMWLMRTVMSKIDDGGRLQVASLPALIEELEALGRKLELPIDDPDLDALLETYGEDHKVDADPAIQAYANVLRAAHEGIRQNQPLWVVK